MYWLTWSTLSSPPGEDSTGVCGGFDVRSYIDGTEAYSGVYYPVPSSSITSPPGRTRRHTISVPHFAAEVFGGMTRGQDSLTSHIQLRGARHDNYIVIDKFTSRGDAWSHHQSDLPIFRTVVVDRPTGRCCSFLFCCCYRRRRWCSSSCRSHMPSATNCNPVTNPAIVVWQ